MCAGQVFACILERHKGNAKQNIEYIPSNLTSISNLYLHLLKSSFSLGLGGQEYRKTFKTCC